MPPSPYDPVTNVVRAGIVTGVSYGFVLLYLLVAALTLDNAAKWRDLFYLGALIFTISLCAALFLLVRHRNGDSAAHAKFAKRLMLLIYVWSTFFIIGLSILTWVTGGLFKSKFTWLFEIAIVITVQITAFADPKNFRTRFGAPLSYTGFIILIYSCMELWPDQNEFAWSHNPQLINWINALYAITIIFVVQALIDRMRLCRLEKLFNVQTT